jgi:cell division protein FtsL
MSTTGPARARATRPVREQRASLRAVIPVHRVPRLPFLLLTLAMMAVGVLGLVALNVSVNQQSFQISRLQRENREAETRWTALQADVDRLKAPARIAKAASAAHLVPAGRARVVAWPGSRVRGRGSASPGAATSPAAPGAGRVARGDDQAGWTLGDPFPLKRYLAEP